MKISATTRILVDRYFRRHPKHTYWKATGFIKDALCLIFNDDPDIRQHVRNDLIRFWLKRITPIKGETNDRVHAAAAWLLRAQSATPDDGASLGYFPCDGQYKGWRASYPETTGYIITTLLRYADLYKDMEAFQAAIQMGKWEISVQMPSGAVQGGPVTTPDKQTPAAFNTGMVLDGWCTAYEHTLDPEFLDAAGRAADFLIHDLDDNGYYRTNGEYVSKGEIKTYTCLCAWAIYRYGILKNSDRHKAAAISSIQAAIKQQKSNGWFNHNCLTFSDGPLTHTIGYTLQGILEVGILAGRPDFIHAAQLSVESVLSAMEPTGYLAGRFYKDWEPACFYSCLTGSAQIAIVCYRLSEHTKNPFFATQADNLLNYLKALQPLDCPVSGFNGAIAGSFPILGDYMRAGCPNWATKYYLDALMLQEMQALLPRK